MLGPRSGTHSCRGVEKAPSTSQHPTLVMLGEDAGWGPPTGPKQASDTQLCLHVAPGVFLSTQCRFMEPQEPSMGL